MINIQCTTVEYQSEKYGMLTKSVPIAYEWLDDVGEVSCRDYPGVDIGDYIEIGPYTAIILDRNPPMDSFVVGKIGDLAGDLRAAFYPFGAWLRIIEIRILQTLVVWNVIKPRTGEELSWELLRERS